MNEVRTVDLRLLFLLSTYLSHLKRYVFCLFFGGDHCRCSIIHPLPADEARRPTKCLRVQFSSRYTMVLQEDFADIVEIRPGRHIFVRKVTIQRGVAERSPASSITSTSSRLQVVLCHGTCASQEQYSLLLQSLAARFSGQHQPHGGSTTTLSCLLWDQVGCGQSPPLPKQHDRKGYSNESIQADLDALLRKFAENNDPRTPSVIVGHSYAASIFLPLLNASTTTTLLPNLCGCILLGTGLRNAHLPLKDGGHSIMKWPVFVLRCWQRGLTESFLQAAVHPAHEHVKQAARADCNANDMAIAQCYHTQHHWADASELTRLVDQRQNKVQILLIHGAADGIIPIECAQKLHSQLLQQQASSDRIAISQFEIIDKASHLVMLEQPEEVADHVCRFLMALLE